LHPAPTRGERSAIDVLIVEDQRLFADVVRLTLERSGMNVVAVIESAVEAREAIERLRPQMVLLDLGLPDGDGLELGDEILEKLPDTKIVAVTARDDPKTVAESIRLGFAGYIPKSFTAAAFARSLESIMDGQLVAPLTPVRGKPRRSAQGARRTAKLTLRERQILGLLAGGATADEIASSLQVSPHTVRTHIQRILEKLDVHSRLQAAAIAVREGLVESSSAQA
jgi:two-component system nitrate/nitrite response regulator NarL